MKLSIIIPLFNEEKLIINVLKELQNVRFPDFLESYEIIIVDDCSTDNSFSVVNDFCKSLGNTKVIKHDINQGKGAAVKTGVSHAGGDVILFQDADLELFPQDIPSLISAKHTLNVPFINGSRYLPGVLRTQSAFKRYFFNKLFTLITSVLIDVHLTDVACGYKLMDKKLFDTLDLKEKRFGFEAELIIKCGRKQKNWIAEIPVRYQPRNKGEGKKLRNLDGFRIFKTILKYGMFRMN
jgi:glycosyltransferase involved in cell wall biosynthesis